LSPKIRDGTLYLAKRAARSIAGKTSKRHFKEFNRGCWVSAPAAPRRAAIASFLLPSATNLW
jgi:hypothetical protein